MGKFNEIQDEKTQSWGGNSFTTTVKEDTVEFDSAKDKFTFKDEVEVPSLKVNGESVSSQVQSDWNQTETSEPDYINNKPFGFVKSTELIASFTINAYSPLPFTVSTDLVAGLTYKVIIAGTEYDIDCVYSSVSHLNQLTMPNNGYIYYDPNHTQAPSPYNAFYSGPKTDEQVQIYCYDKLVKISDDYLSGKLIIKGGAEGAEIFNNNSNTATGKNSHSEGQGTTASGDYSHSEGYNTTASGESSHSEGKSTTASGQYSHSEGQGTTASGKRAHSEGNGTTASGDYSHSEGYSTVASGKYSHSEGSDTTASGDYSHSSGYQTTANHKSQFTFGEYNISDPSAAAATARGTYVEIVGNGTGSSARSNARTLDWDGNEMLSGTLTIGGASGATIKVESGALKVSFDGGTTWLTISAS